MSEELCELGVIGLSVLGQSFAAHHASSFVTNKFRRVCVCDTEDAGFANRVVDEYRRSVDEANGNDDGHADANNRRGAMVQCAKVEDMVHMLHRPRRIVVCGTYGNDASFVESCWMKLHPLLEEGDVVLRWGKEEDDGDDDDDEYEYGEDDDDDDNNDNGDVANGDDDDVGDYRDANDACGDPTAVPSTTPRGGGGGGAGRRRRRRGGTASGGAIQFYDAATLGKLSTTQARPNGVHLLEMVRLARDRVPPAPSSNANGNNNDIDDPTTKDDATANANVRSSHFHERDHHHRHSYLVGGGSKEAYALLEPYLTAFDSISQVAHAGSDVRCAHYAFMIQRAIENGVMQIYAEGSDVLRRAAGYENNDIGRTFKNWNEGNANANANGGGGAGGGGLSNSYLTGITSKIFYKRDALTKCGFVVDHIVDSMISEPVDTWATLEATRLNLPAPTINAAQETRFLSVMRDERSEASSMLRIPDGNDTPSVLKDQISEDLHNAMYCACLLVVSECLSLFEAASEVGSWDVNLEECVRMWKRPGSLLQSTFMNRVHSALADDMGDSNCLLTIPIIASELQCLHMSWRRIVTLCFASAIPCPTMSSSLTHYDTYRCERLPVALVRAQRDYYDASGYDRLSERGWFSTCWIKEHTTTKRREAAGGNKRTRKRKATSEGL